MSKILIIQLRRFGDIFYTGHLIQSIKKDNPSAEISLLVYKEFSRATETVSNDRTPVTIDRKKTLQLKSSPLFNNGIALDSFLSDLDEVDQEWNQIINISNDSISTLLSSYLQGEEKKGLSLNNDKSLKYSSYWNIVYNDICSELKDTPFSYMELYHKILDIPWASSENSKTIFQPVYNEKVFSSFNTLRSEKGNPNAKVVGIQLCASTQEKSIHQDKIIELVKILKNDINIVPILLIAPIQDELEKAEYIRGALNNEVMAIESDFKTLSSVLNNLDLLITPDTSVKHLADLTETPMIEISLGSSPLFKQNTVISGNFLIYPFDGDSNHLRASDIANLCLEMVGIGNEKHEYGQNITIYSVQRKEQNLEYIPYAGDLNIYTELNRMVAKEVSSLISEDKVLIDMNLHLMSFKNEEITNWLGKQSIALMDCSKSLLKALRAINVCKKSPAQVGIFLDALEELLTNCSTNTMVSIPTIIFRAQLDSLQSTNIVENMNNIEIKLFGLKNKIKILSKVFEKMREHKEIERTVQL